MKSRKFEPRRKHRRNNTEADQLRHRTIGRPLMRTLFLAAIAGSVAWSSTAMAERYQVLPVITHMGAAKLDYTALLLDTGAGIAFSCSAQFDPNLSKFICETAFLVASVDYKLPPAHVP